MKTIASFIISVLFAIISMSAVMASGHIVAVTGQVITMGAVLTAISMCWLLIIL